MRVGSTKLTNGRSSVPRLKSAVLIFVAEFETDKSIRYLTPRGVEKYIETQQVYLAKK